MIHFFCGDPDTDSAGETGKTALAEVCRAPVFLVFINKLIWKRYTIDNTRHTLRNLQRIKRSIYTSEYIFPGLN